MLAQINDLIVANVATNLVDTLKAYIGPILLLIIGAISLTFLFKRQVSQFLTFLAIAIVVAIIFYAPDVITNIAQGFVTDSGSGTWNG